MILSIIVTFLATWVVLFIKAIAPYLNSKLYTVETSSFSKYCRQFVL